MKKFNLFIIPILLFSCSNAQENSIEFSKEVETITLHDKEQKIDSSSSNLVFIPETNYQKTKANREKQRIKLLGVYKKIENY